MSIQDIINGIRKHRIGAREQGFTLIEGLVTVAMVSVMAAVVIPAIYNEFEKARISNCLAELDGMKAMAFSLGDGRYVPTPEQFWNQGYPDAEPGQYYYIVDNEDHNLGHGNDLDGCDEDNPGNSPRCPGANFKFVVFCSHNHGKFGKYCYATDQSPPTLVTWEEDDPYDFLSQKDINQGDDPKPTGKKPKKK